MGLCGKYSAFYFGVIDRGSKIGVVNGVSRANHGPTDSNAVSPTITPHLASPVNLPRSVMENSNTAEAQLQASETPAKKGRRGKRDAGGEDSKKRRCISSACVPCRKRKSKVGHVG